ncbi:MAG TPA: response regulator transcription factor [Planctomycetes bacterium]|nr:response regulator transcription factor [Planctomycetota bacterium]
MKIRILLVDDHRMMRDGLRAILAARPAFQIVGEADHGRAAIEAAGKLKPDVIVMDVGMPDMNGIEATKRILAESPGIKVIALSTHSDKRYVLNMMTAGACGYVLKEAAADDLVRAVDAAHRGEHYLSPQVTGVALEPMLGQLPRRGPGSSYRLLGAREREVLQLLAEGRTSKAIAEKLGLSIKTIETHRRNIGQKLGIKSIAELTKYAVREGITSLEQ